MYPCLVIDIYQCVQDIFRPGGKHILEAEDDHRCLFPGDSGGEIPAVALGLAHAVYPLYRIWLVPSGKVHCRSQHQAAHRSHECIGRKACHRIGFYFFRAHHEVAQHQDTVFTLFQTETERGLRNAFHYFEFHRGVRVVFHTAEYLLLSVCSLEPEAFHHYLHEIRRSKRLDLVVHVLS